MGRTFSWIERIAVFLLTFFASIWILIQFKFWSADLVGAFFLTGRWPELIFVIAFSMLVAKAIEILVQAEFHLQFLSPERGTASARKTKSLIKRRR